MPSYLEVCEFIRLRAGFDGWVNVKDIYIAFKSFSQIPNYKGVYAAIERAENYKLIKSRKIEGKKKWSRDYKLTYVAKNYFDHLGNNSFVKGREDMIRERTPDAKGRVLIGEDL